LIGKPDRRFAAFARAGLELAPPQLPLAPVQNLADADVILLCGTERRSCVASVSAARGRLDRGCDA
jgi:hypothetical protein